MSSMTNVMPREAWEQAGYEVAAHTTNGPVNWSLVTNVTIHYPGGGTFPAKPDEAWLKGYMQRMQRDYVDNRGYSIGYNEVVADALVAEGRGERTQCAANGTSATNKPSYAIQIAVSNTGRPSDSAIAVARERIAWAQSKAGRKLDILGHRDHKPTACPGDVLYAMVKDGTFDVPFGTTPPDPVEPPPAPSGTGIITEVRAGENYYSISRRVFKEGDGNGNPQALQAANGNKALHPGDILVVPGKVTRG